MKDSMTRLLAPAFALGLFAGTSASAATLLHHWTFDVDGSDAAGSADTTLDAGTAIVAGQFGNALSTPSTAAGAVAAPGAVVLPTSDFSFVAWVKQDASNTEGNGTIMGNQEGGAVAGVFLRADTEGVDGDLFGRVNNASGDLIEGGTIANNVWTHVAMTVSSVDGLTIYVNGVSAGNNAAGTSHVLVNPLTTTFEIGTRSGNEVQAFHGLIDDVAIYNGVLDATDLADIIANGVVPEPSSLALLAMGGLLIARRRRD